MKANFTNITIFLAAYVGTDCLFYHLKPPYYEPHIWPRILALRSKPVPLEGTAAQRE